ncbi:hypothetical protein RRG08_011863 [Elysia crispata]|uniref:Secreted protein n=1 Tax=Elysia crispata TaxID=231223 RepID=A0AAE0ZMB6_9GAST|nr:hypothetical protein RRG08_011863 [Elysia crispata]
MGAHCETRISSADRLVRLLLHTWCTFFSCHASLSMPHSNTENRQEKRPQAPRQERTNLGDERQPVDLERISRPAGRRDLTLRRSAVTV